METLSKLTGKLEDEISTLNNELSLIQSSNHFEVLIASLNENNITSLDFETAERIINIIHDETTQDLERILLSFSKLSKENKETLYENFGFYNNGNFKTIQKKLIEYCEKSILSEKNDVKNKIGLYKKLLSKLKSSELNIIDEINLILDIISDLSVEEQIDIFKDINRINLHVSDNYLGDISFIDDYNELPETNISSEEIKILFEKYNVNISESNEYVKLIQKYGNLTKIDSILNFLVDKNLNFIFSEDNAEVLYRTLIYSSVLAISEVINLSESRHLEYILLFEKNPTLFYPAHRIREKKQKAVFPPSKGDVTLTGSQDSFKDNIDFLEKNGFSCKTVFEDCLSFFAMSPKIVKKTYERLSMYKLSLKYPDGDLRKCFSVLKNSCILDQIDIAIESKCFDYIQRNLSKLPSFDEIGYYIKYGVEKYSSDFFFNHEIKDIKGKPTVKIRQGNLNNLKTKVGNVFEIYGAIDVEDYIPSNYILYNEILDNNENDKITNIVLNNAKIQFLDENYKESDLEYKFDGVVISRNKVLRFYETLLSSPEIIYNDDMLLYSVTKNSMLNEEEMNKIIKCLNLTNIKRRVLK